MRNRSQFRTIQSGTGTLQARATQSPPKQARFASRCARTCTLCPSLATLQPADTRSLLTRGLAGARQAGKRSKEDKQGRQVQPSFDRAPPANGAGQKNSMGRGKRHATFRMPFGFESIWACRSPDKALGEGYLVSPREAARRDRKAMAPRQPRPASNTYIRAVPPSGTEVHPLAPLLSPLQPPASERL